MFDCESDLLDRVIDRFMGHVRGSAFSANVERQAADRDGIALVSVNPSASAKEDAAREGYTHARCWAILPSRRTPRWLLPLGDRRGTISGAQIYQPQARTMRMMKWLLIRGMQAGWDRWIRDRVLIAWREPLALERLLTEITGEPNPIFALSVGNQRATRKLTVQVMRPSGEILGYIKLPLTEAATERVHHEAETLERLSAFPSLRPHIPQVLYAGHCNGTFILFQTSVEGEQAPNTLQKIHENFLEKLWNVHRTQKAARTLVQAVADQWERSGAERETDWKELGREVLRQTMRDLNQVIIPCGVMHGDFAPWNTRVHPGGLFLFDWESAVWEAPHLWDVFHFNVQTSCFLKTKATDSASLRTPVERGSYLLYLLSSGAQLIAEGADRTGINYRRMLLKEILSQQVIPMQAMSKKKGSFDAIGVTQN